MDHGSAKKTGHEVTLKYSPREPAGKIAIVGTFNDWDPNAHLLKPEGDGKVWSATLFLEPGMYSFRYFIDDKNWANANDMPVVKDGQGNDNSLLTVTPEGYENPADEGDGSITEDAVGHAPTAEYITRLSHDCAAITVRTRRDDVQHCTLLVGSAASVRATVRKGNEAGTRREAIRAELPMARMAQDALFDYWRIETALPRRGHLAYAFRLDDGTRTNILDAAPKMHSGKVPEHWFDLDPSLFPVFDTPEWSRDAIFYHIFVDRFANGNVCSDPPETQPWQSPPTGDVRQGGDLEGIISKMDYLRDLGINALYLSPIFAARSNHGYDTTDYHRVDPHFGSSQTLKSLVDRAHHMKWHVILDGVMNHTGVDFKAFRSLRKHGEKSPYRNWYFVKGFPIEVKDGQVRYETFKDTPWLPKLNTGNRATRRYLLEVGRRWIREAGVDGWRLDAADDVAHDFWRDFRKAIRKEKADAYLVGEIWPPAGEWLQGNEFDAVTNYPWRAAVLDFFAQDKISPAEFETRMADLRTAYAPAVNAVQFNILGSHDTERLRNLCQGNWKRQRQAALFQLTYPGTPCLYYGDEIGMEGSNDPDNRRAMPWDEAQWDKAIYSFYKQAIALRNNRASLRRGDYATLLADNATGIFAFQRRNGNELALIVFNRGDAPQQIEMRMRDRNGAQLEPWLADGAVLTQTEEQVKFTLEARAIGVFGA